MRGEIFRVTWWGFYRTHLRHNRGILPIPGEGGPPAAADPRPALDNPFGRIGLHGVTMKRYVVGFSKGAPAVSVNVSGTWKDVTEISVNVSGSWKTVTDTSVNVSGTWKTV